MFLSTDPEHSNVFMTDVALATASAPAFFVSHKVGEDTYIDGGIAANNPSLCALIQALRITNLEDIYVLSIGTGIKKYDPMEHIVLSRGIMYMLTFLPRVIFDAQINLVDQQMQTILKKGQYTRIQLEMNRLIGLDSISNFNIHL